MVSVLSFPRFRLMVTWSFTADGYVDIASALLQVPMVDQASPEHVEDWRTECDLEAIGALPAFGITDLIGARIYEEIEGGPLRALAA